MENRHIRGKQEGNIKRMKMNKWSRRQSQVCWRGSLRRTALKEEENESSSFDATMGGES